MAKSCFSINHFDPWAYKKSILLGDWIFKILLGIVFLLVSLKKKKNLIEQKPGI